MSTPPIYTLIPFRGQEILSVVHDGKRFIVPKQICENLGLDWEGQRQKIQRDTVLSQGACVIQVPLLVAIRKPFAFLSNTSMDGFFESMIRE